MLAGDQLLFLILDDAFQHSDWWRRDRLVEEVVRLAKDGRQVTYLTMDEHLRGLFCETGKKNFGDAFTFAEIWVAAGQQPKVEDKSHSSETRCTSPQQSK